MRCVLVGTVTAVFVACMTLARAEDVEWHAAAPTARLQNPSPLRAASFDEKAGSKSPTGNPSAALPIEAATQSTNVEQSVKAAKLESKTPESGFKVAAFTWPDNPMGQPAAEPIGPPRKIESDPKPIPSPRRVWRGPVQSPSGLNIEPIGNCSLFNEEPLEPARRLFFRGEYLLWFTKQMNAPPLVTTAPTPTGSPPTSFGFLGQPGTVLLYGGDEIGNPFHQGGRFTTGLWLDDCQTCGIEASFFFLGESIERFHADSNSFAILTRPFFRPNAPNPQESGQIVSFPAGFTFGNTTAIPDVQGAIDVRASTSLWGAEFNAKECLCRCGARFGGYCVDLFAGFRYLDLQDQLGIQENLLVGQNDPVVPAGTVAQVNDRFSTHNQFYGGQIGFRGEYHWGALFTELKGSIALGGTAQTSVIDGNQFVTQPGQPTQVFQGGLLAVRSNMGRHTTGAFSFVPELAINTGVQVTPGLKLFVGYDFMFWTRVMRASEQIDRVVDVNQVPNFVPPGVFSPVFPARPAVLLRQNDFWAQGVQVGMEMRW